VKIQTALPLQYARRTANFAVFVPEHSKQSRVLVHRLLWTHYALLTLLLLEIVSLKQHNYYYYYYKSKDLKWHYHIKDVAGTLYKIKEKKNVCEAQIVQLLTVSRNVQRLPISYVISTVTTAAQ